MRVRDSLCWVFGMAVMWGCGSAPGLLGNQVTVTGSDTMLELDRRLAEEFMRAHPGDRVVIEGGGTGVGIEALIEGTASIAAASRPLSAAEVAALHERHQTLGVRHLIAQDALSVVVNQANPVRDLSMDQLRAIFAGGISNWSDVGGEDGDVTVVVRPPSSGTHRFFRDHVLAGRPYIERAVTEPSTRGVLERVAGDRSAIGYGGLAYRGEGVVQISVAGVEPTPENMALGRYPLIRYLVFYTRDPPTGLTRRFVEWCLSAPGQEVVAEVGYVPLWPVAAN